MSERDQSLHSSARAVASAAAAEAQRHRPYLLPLAELVKDKGADENQQRRQQAHLVAVFDFADEIEHLLQRPVKQYEQGYGKTAKEGDVVPSEKSHGSGVISATGPSQAE